MIFGGTGDQWLAGVDPESFAAMNQVASAPLLMQSPATSRRLAHAIVQRPWRQRLVADLGFGLALVSYGARLGLGQH